MPINLTGHHIEVTPALRQLTEQKFDKLERHFDHITNINVVFNIEKLMQVAEGSVTIAKKDFHARAESDDLYKAIDELVEKLDKQLLKHKEKIRNHHHRD